MKYDIRIKRVYERPDPLDGYRILIDRLWPRGVRKVEACIDEWNRSLPPTTELRQWFNHDPERFKEFASRYKSQLRGKREELERIIDKAKWFNITLLYAAKDPQVNHARVLQAVLWEL